MIEWSLDAFRACDPPCAIVVAAPAGHDHDLDGDDLSVVAGGASRAQSVANALEAVGTELVAIHDAARPLLRPELVEGLVAALEDAPTAAAVIAAAPVTDTVKQAADPGDGTKTAFDTPSVSNAVFVKRTVDRSRLWAAQTPQVFRTQALREALEVDAGARDAATDEAMLVEAAGGRVLIHPAPAENFKVTTQLDLRLAELVLAERGA
jgi:2-C-methyl-D-erythritol 4-phosphate cytidylyltransferase